MMKGSAKSEDQAIVLESPYLAVKKTQKMLPGTYPKYAMAFE